MLPKGRLLFKKMVIFSYGIVFDINDSVLLRFVVIKVHEKITRTDSHYNESDRNPYNIACSERMEEHYHGSYYQQQADNYFACI